MTRNGYRPTSLQEAVTCRAATGGMLYAGGTDTMVRLRQWGGAPSPSPSDIIFIGHLRELQKICREGDNLVIGACATMAELELHPETPAILKQIIGGMASPAVRNLATIGGNICNASPAGDTLPFLYAVDAEVVLLSEEGQRRLAIDRFISGPGKIDLALNEILVAVSFSCGGFTHEFYKKVAARRANSLSKISLTGLACKNGQGITDLRIALGAVGPTVVRSREIEHSAMKCLSAAGAQARVRPEIDSIIADYSALINPIDDQRSTALYRREASLRLLDDYLQTLL